MYKYINQQVQIYSDKKYSFITGNGTSAIYLALQSSGVPKGSKIVVPNISCPDPVYALIWAGYKPVFVDVNIADYNMDITKLEQALKADKQIKAIIAIHLFGNACDIVNIQKLAKKHDCFLLEDCAQAFGNEIDEGKLGSFGDVSIFSFGNGKILEVGHGGSVQSNDKKIVDKIQSMYKMLNNYDVSKVEALAKRHRSIYYKLYYLGIKFPRLNILNLIYVYFFKRYYLYQIDTSYLKQIEEKIASFTEDKKQRVEMINNYIEALPNIVTIPKLNNKENILSRLTVMIPSAEMISKSIRDNEIPSNTMYPLLIDRFQMSFDKKEYSNSYALKDKMLNLWVNVIESEQIAQTINILKSKVT